MAKQSSTRAKLSVPHERAAEVLAEARGRGEAVRAGADSVHHDHSFQEWADEATRWRRYALAAIQSISEGEALEDEFGRASAVGAVSLGPVSTSELLRRRLATLDRELNVIRGIEERLELVPGPEGAKAARVPVSGRDVFVVHGSQTDRAQVVARFIERFGLKALILFEQPNEGRTLVEKLEHNSATAGYAVVLLQKDDWGRGPDDDDWPAEPNRARQNVILELGFFVGLIGRGRVAALMEKGVEKPSDIHGLAYVPFDGGWEMLLAKELKTAFPDIDVNLAFS